MKDLKTIARNISLIENRSNGYETLLLQAGTVITTAAVIGITGAPGAGKSTLIDKLIEHIIAQQKTVAVLCIDPSSPFNMGAVLGDRVRMSRWYLHDDVYIRSLASRRALGGLSPMIIEITDYLKTEAFDFIIVETVGVGQSEVDIAGLADVTIVTLVPEGGDEIQTMKSGLMEIADIFVLNKYDRPGADKMLQYLHAMLTPANHETAAIPVVKTIAEEGKGIDELYKAIGDVLQSATSAGKKSWLLAEKAWQLIQEKRMMDMDKKVLAESIQHSLATGNFNLYRFVQELAVKQ